MKIDDQETNDSPSLIWVLPLACSVWIGLFVDGWFARPSARNLVFVVIDPIFASLLLPALTLMLAWLLMTPARLFYRLQAVLFLLISSVPIAYAAQQRPGQPPFTVRELAEYYTDRYYLLEFQALPCFEAGLAIVAAALCLVLLNRLLSQIVFQRVPLAPATNGKRWRQRLSEAYHMPIHSAARQVGRDRRGDRQLGVLVVILIGGGAWQWISGQGEHLPAILRTGCLLGSVVYLWIWMASECYHPWRSFAVLLLGTTGLASLPQIARLTMSTAQLSTPDPYWIIVASVSVSAALAALSLGLLTWTHQMPRRGKSLPGGAAVPAAVSANSLSSTSWIGFWASGLLLGGIGCSVAYWVPLNVDAVELTDEGSLSPRDGWLAARFLEKTAGDRRQFKIGRDPATGKPTVHWRVPALEKSWRESVALVEQRARDGDLCSLEIESPVSDRALLADLLRQGIEVTCSLDAAGEEVPATLMTARGLQLRRIINAPLDVEAWRLLQTAHPQLLEIVGCRLPDEFPTPIGPNRSGEPTILRDCEFSNELLSALTSFKGWPSHALIEPRFKQPIDGLTFAKFIYNLEVLGAPPLSSPVRDGFPPLFVPTFVSEAYSRWTFSTRPVLLDPRVFAKVTEQPVSLQRHLGFDAAGRLVELGVLPTRDCPAAIPWGVLPDVEHLYVNLTLSSYDPRMSPDDVFRGEEIGFQVAALPRLTRVTIYRNRVHHYTQTVNSQLTDSHDAWDARREKFLRELLQHPGLVEVRVERSFGTPFWDTLAAGESIERLVVEAGQDLDLPWLETLARLPRLKEIFLVDHLGLRFNEIANWPCKPISVNGRSGARPASPRRCLDVADAPSEFTVRAAGGAGPRIATGLFGGP
jgi:hypothetical protein